MGLDLVNYEEVWRELIEFFGDRLANPDTEPRRFESQLKIFKHVRDINNNGQKPFNNIPQGKENGI